VSRGILSQPRPRSARGRAAILAAASTLAALVAALALAGFAGGGSAARDENSLAALSESAGCQLLEVYRAHPTNPPTSGAFRERDRVRDLDYSGARTPPPLRAVLHALEHGRVLLQYRPRSEPRTVAALRRLYRQDGYKTLLFENQTGMRYEVAAVAYLSAVVCPRFTTRALPVLRAFQVRRREFKQGL
jgi:hypothetical protein